MHIMYRLILGLMKLSTGDIKFSVVLHPKNEERSLK